MQVLGTDNSELWQMCFVISISLVSYYVPNKTPKKKKFVFIIFGALTSGTEKAPLCCRKADAEGYLFT